MITPLAVGSQEKSIRKRSEKTGIRMMFSTVPSPSCPFPTMSMMMITRLTMKVAVPKERPLLPEMPSASVFHAFVPAPPALTPMRLEKP